VLLDQFDLHAARLGKGDREIEALALATMVIVFRQHDMRHQQKRADPRRANPVHAGGFKVIDHEGSLHEMPARSSGDHALHQSLPRTMSLSSSWKRWMRFS
jgi:hypothetical protein